MCSLTRAGLARVESSATQHRSKSSDQVSACSRFGEKAFTSNGSGCLCELAKIVCSENEDICPELNIACLA
jgi:hypothetical protein